MPSLSRWKRILPAAALALGLAAFPLAADEHPEHPTGRSMPTACPNATPTPAYRNISMPQLGRAIRAAIAAQARRHGGRFSIWDPVQKRRLSLSLLRVHKDKLAKVANGLYFACTDMKGPHAVYDLDFFMREDKAGALAFSRVSVHKKDGKARYDWAYDREAGLWKQVPLKR